MIKYKNIIFVLTAIGVAIVLVIAFSSMSATLTLDQIIKNKDCSALEKWEEEHMFDDDLNMSSEQLSAAMSLAAECVGKALGNMLGNLALSTDTTDPMVILDEILKQRDCDGLVELIRDRPNYENMVAGMTMPVMEEMAILADECRK